ncbi:MAG: TIR domain-containing protein, partial [Candidatus Methylumidiphilus sp.]
MNITLHDVPIKAKKSPSIFLSYGREDQNIVKEIYDKLSDIGFSPWMDTENLLPGELWLKTISNVIDYCDFFLICLSPRSVDKRGYLQKEIKDALKIWETKLDSDIFLIPLKLEDNFVVPEDISCFQYISLTHSHWMDKLTQAIESGLNRRSSGEPKLNPNIINRWQDDPDLSIKCPYLNITLSLFERHIFHDLMLSKIETQLIADYSWPEERAHAACFVLNELVSNAFEHGCRGCGELEVSFTLRFQRANKDLIIRVTSPGPGFVLSKVLDKGDPELILGDRGRGLLFVNRIASQLTASSDGRIIEAIVLRDSQLHSITSLHIGLFHGSNSALIVNIHEESL